MARYATIGYRSDIDGLRGIAVIAVILYHAFPEYIKGGFVGVDIFFVISGYLIGSILFKNFDDNSFCFYTFYARRIKRIFPALIGVVLFALIFGWFSLTDTEYVNLSSHIRASALFYTNFTLAKESGYFDVATHLKPMMHLWSLAVEEQFYIVCPVLLYFAYRMRINLLAVCTTIAVVSFVLSIRAANSAPIMGFYSTVYRAWELMSGVLLAYIVHNRLGLSTWIKNSRLSAWHKDVIASIGFIISLTSMFMLKHASYYMVLPVLGTVCMIAAGEKTWINRNILSNKACVTIGLISYPLYLWHWPLLSFLFIFNGTSIGVWIKLAAMLISFIMSWIVYKFIETPIRTAKDYKLVIWTLGIMFIGVIGITAHTVVSNLGYKNRSVNVANANAFLQPQFDQRFLNLEVSCDAPYNSSSKKEFSAPFCIVNSSNPKYLVIGDSHATSFSYDAAVNNTLDMAMVSLTGQPASINYVSYSKLTHAKDQRATNLRLFNKSIKTMLESFSSIEYIILISRGPVYFNRGGFGIEQGNDALNHYVTERVAELHPKITSKEAFFNGYIESIKFLSSKGKQVIFVVDFPELGEDPTLCLKRMFNFMDTAKSCIINKDALTARQQEYRELIMQMQQEVPNLLVYDPTGSFCDQTQCYGKKDILLYADNNHLNLAGSTVLMHDFKQWLQANGVEQLP